MNAEEDASASTGCSICHPQARVPAGYMSAGVIPESVTCQHLWTNRASHGRPGRVEIDGTSCVPAVSFSDSLPFSYLRADGLPMTATPWLRLRSVLPTGSGLYAGHAARGRQFVAALRRGRPRAAPWPDEYGKGRGLSVRRGRGVRSHRMPTGPILIGSPYGGTARSGAPPKRRIPSLTAVGVASAPRSLFWRIDRGIPCACA